MAASVCTALMKDEDPVSLVVTGRLSALTMPEVTVELSPSGRAEGHHLVTDPEHLGGAEARRRQRGRALHVQHGEVVGRAAAHHLGGVLVAVLVDDLDRPVVLDRVGDDVVVGDVVPRPVEHEAGPGRSVLLALVLRQHLDRARQQPLRDRGDRPVVRRERRLRLGPRVRETAAHLTLGGVAVQVLVRGAAEHAADDADDQRQSGDERPHPARHPALARSRRTVLDGVGLDAERRVGRATSLGSGVRRVPAGGGPGGVHWCGSGCSRGGSQPPPDPVSGRGVVGHVLRSLVTGARQRCRNSRWLARRSRS